MLPEMKDVYKNSTSVQAQINFTENTKINLTTISAVAAFTTKTIIAESETGITIGTCLSRFVDEDWTIVPAGKEIVQTCTAAFHLEYYSRYSRTVYYLENDEILE